MKIQGFYETIIFNNKNPIPSRSRSKKSTTL